MALAVRKTISDVLTAAKWFIRRGQFRNNIFITRASYVFVTYETCFLDCRAYSTLPEKAETPQVVVEIKKPSGRRPSNPGLEFRHIYPEFLPDPNPKWRNSLREKLERADMLQRRNKIDIPEFYVGKFFIGYVWDQLNTH